MWYVKLLEYLAEIICKTDADNAVDFINDLFAVIKEKELDPEIIFGFLNDFYNFVWINQHQDLSLERMARFSVGLIIVHFKKAWDEGLKLTAFIDVLEHQYIWQALNLHSKKISVRFDYITGQRVHPKITPIPNYPTAEQNDQNKFYLPRVVNVCLLKELESNTLAQLNYTVRVNLFETVFVLNDLLNKVTCQKEIVMDLFDFILPYHREDWEFDQLVKQLGKALDSFPAPNPFSEPNNSNNSAQERRKINLVIVPKLPIAQSREIEYRVPPLPLSPAIIYIIECLEEYKPLTNCGPLHFFFCGVARKHTREVAGVIEQIKTKELFTVASIIERLDQIKIIKHDELEQILKDIKKRHPYHCPRTVV